MLRLATTSAAARPGVSLVFMRGGGRAGMAELAAKCAAEAATSGTDTATTGGAAKCEKCGQGVPMGAVACGHCATALSYFRVLGMDEAFDLNHGKLRASFYDRQRQLHPDKAAGQAEVRRHDLLMLLTPAY